MRKGTTTTMLLVIMGIIVGVVLILAINPLSGALVNMLSGERTEDVHSEKEFAVLVDKIKILGETEKMSMLYGAGEEYVVIGFPKDKKGINGVCGGVAGGKRFSVNGEIVKPLFAGCDEKKSCLCLCKGGLNAGVCGGSETTWCYGFEFDIADNGNSCGWLVIDGYDFGMLYMKRDKDKLLIGRTEGAVWEK